LLLTQLAWILILLFQASCCSWDDRHRPPKPNFVLPLRWVLTNLNHNPPNLSLLHNLGW
jgi:hypothetical protein